MVASLMRPWRLTPRPAAVGPFVVVWSAVAAAASAPATAQDAASISGHSVGELSAPVWVIEFADFGCGACAAFTRQTLPRIREEAARGTVRYIVIPFDIGAFRSRTAAVAAGCAAEQDAFWAMHDLLYARRSDWSGRGGQPERFARYAEELDLDAARFAACLQGRASHSAVERSTEIAKRCRVRGTPTFFVNGERLEGALPTGQFLAAVEAGKLRTNARGLDCLN